MVHPVDRMTVEEPEAETRFTLFTTTLSISHVFAFHRPTTLILVITQDLDSRNKLLLPGDTENIPCCLGMFGPLHFGLITGSIDSDHLENVGITK